MTRKDATKLFTRFLVIFGLCIPVFIGIGIALGDNRSGFLETLIYVVIGALALLIEEYFYWKNWKKRMIAKNQTIPEKYFAEIKRIQMEKRNVKVVEQPNQSKKAVDNSIKKINVNKRGKK